MKLEQFRMGLAVLLLGFLSCGFGGLLFLSVSKKRERLQEMLNNLGIEEIAHIRNQIQIEVVSANVFLVVGILCALTGLVFAIRII